MFHSHSPLRTPLIALIVLLIGLALAADPAVAPAEPNSDLILDHAYAGFLHVLFTGSKPEFKSTAMMDVSVNRDGSVIISNADMSYGGTVSLQGCEYERTGTWNIAPTGVYLPGPPEHIAVDEHIFFSEHLMMTCPPPAGVVMNEYPSGTLNGGLAFDFLDAQMDGAVVMVDNGEGDVIKWTMGLVVRLPTERCSWSAIKALYSD